MKSAGLQTSKEEASESETDQEGAAQEAVSSEQPTIRKSP